ncbi:MAG: DUF2061 domain-containing protein [Hyphomicrobiales bacterium]
MTVPQGTSTKHNALRKKPAEKLSRSILKAVSWRVLGSIDTFLLSFLVLKFGGNLLPIDIADTNSGLVATAATIAIVEVVTKIIIYTVHEQIWTRIDWGQQLNDGEAGDQKRRSIAKTATWRITATLDTTLLAWFFTGSPTAAITIGSLEILTKLVLYYLHERFWNKIGSRKTA